MDGLTRALLLLSARTGSLSTVSSSVGMACSVSAESRVTPRRPWLATPLALVLGITSVIKLSGMVPHIVLGLSSRLQGFPHLFALAPRLLNIRHRLSVSPISRVLGGLMYLSTYHTGHSLGTAWATEDFDEWKSYDVLACRFPRFRQVPFIRVTIL